MDRLEAGRHSRRPQGNSEGLAELRQPRRDVFEVVTEQILEKLAQGVVPWQSPSVARVGLPRNFSTGNAYSGINVFLLGAHEFQSPFFLTFLQARELGGTVRRGEHGMLIVKMGTWKRDPAANSWGTGVEPNPETTARRFLKVYTVFNACQIDGIDFPVPPVPETFTESARAEKANALVAGMPNPPLIHQGRKAYPHYLPAEDTVEMPARQTFRAEWRYYKTLFHELGHATGHATRLNRKSLIENRGMYASGSAQKIYCQEELVAEMTAAFLGVRAGIIEDDLENSAAYLKGWLEVLRVSDHRTWLIKAASDAQRAANYILNEDRPTESANSAEASEVAPDGPLNTPP